MGFYFLIHDTLLAPEGMLTRDNDLFRDSLGRPQMIARSQNKLHGVVVKLINSVDVRESQFHYVALSQGCGRL
jgi:hypothetical protein